MRTIVVGLTLLFCFVSQAEAKHRHHHHRQHHHHSSYHHEDQTGTVYLPHPAGCPRTSFCACGASTVVFGRPIRSLWPSRAWFHFPRALPGHNMAAVRSGHVFILDRHDQGDIWWVKDFNSGGHRSRYHRRSIRGYAIVNPMASRYASTSHAL